jgi:hypothetical protein
MRNSFAKAVKAILAILAVGLVAGSPAMAENVEIYDETGESPVPCSEVEVDSETEVVTGGCEIHVVSDGTISYRRHVFGVETLVAACNEEFQVNLDEDGRGYMSQVEWTGSSPCGEFEMEDGEPWELEIEEEAAAARYYWHGPIAWRYVPPFSTHGPDWWTWVNATVSADDDTTQGTNVEITGDWVIEDPDAFHVEHL